MKNYQKSLFDEIYNKKKKDKKTLIYFIYNDRIESGILKAQVYQPLINAKNYQRKYLLLLWQPHIFFNEFKKIKKLKNNLLQREIFLICLPIAFPSKYFEKSLFFKFYLKILGKIIGNVIIFLKNFFERKNANQIILIARSYHAALIATFVKKKIKEITFIFDPRSLYPEESRTVQKWALGSKEYFRWKYIENLILKESDKLISISQPMRNWFISQNYKKPIINQNFYINDSILKYDFKNEKERLILRENLKLTKEHIVFGFVGSIGKSYQWNSIYSYIQHLNSIFYLLEINKPLIFAIRSNWLNKSVKDILIKNLKIPVIFLNELSIEQSLLVFDIGCHLLLDGPDNFTRIGIKVHEYLFSGLPILTNSSAGAAKDLARKCNALIDAEDVYFDKSRFKNKFLNKVGFLKRSIISERYISYRKSYNSKKI